MELWDSNPEHEEEIPGNPFGQPFVNGWRFDDVQPSFHGKKKRNHHPICHFECVDVSLVPGISTHKNPPSLFFFDAASHVTQIFGEVAVSHGNTMQKRCGRSNPMVILVVFF